MEIIKFDKHELPAIAATHGWSPHDKEVIKQIAQEWCDTGLASSVLLAFKEKDKVLHAYMPVVPIDNNKRPDAKDKPSERGEAAIIGIEPYPLNGTQLEKGDFILIDRIMKIMLQNYWTGDRLFRISDGKNSQKFRTDVPITREIIEFGRARIRAVEAVTGKAPQHLVAVVDAMQHEYDGAIR